MWKRNEAVKSTNEDSGTPGTAAQQVGAPAAQAEARRRSERDIVNIGKSVVIKGELTASEDLTVEGMIEGKIEVRDNILTIGPNGRIKANVFARGIIVLGEIVGNVTASENVDIRDGGAIDGDLVSPRVSIADGGHFRGTVDMQKKAGQATPAVQKTAPVAGVPQHGKPAAAAAAH
jgi:cytoskeletal protein CcmA (bactofilin family)